MEVNLMKHNRKIIKTKIITSLGFGKYIEKYNAHGDIISRDDMCGNTKHHTDYMYTTTKSEHIETAVYNIGERIIKEILTYDDTKLLIKADDGYGNIYSYEYDDNGNCISVIRNGSDIVETSLYDEHGLLIENTLDGIFSAFTYDFMSNIRTITNSKGDIVERELYDEDGNIILQENPISGHTIRYKYNSDGNCTDRLFSCGFWTKYKYNSNGDCVRIITNGGDITDIYYEYYTDEELAEKDKV